MTGAFGKRAAIYVRVSSEEQVQGYSLAAQERAAAAYCTSHGWDVAAVYRDEGRSARTDDVAKRPDFARMLADAEAGRVDVVVVHKLDRFSRNRRIAFEALDRLGKARVGFVSISEDMDYSTSSGQLMLTMLVGMGQFYSDNLSFETKKGKAERKRQGMYNGHLPYGTTKGPDGVPILDTTPQWCDVATRAEVIPAEGLRLAFELAASGKSDREVARALNAAGHRTSGNRGQNPLSKDTVRVILQNRFYLGELTDGSGGWLPARHGVLVDPVVFARAQAQRQGNTDRPRWTEAKRTPWALSGVGVCGGCGRPLNVMNHASGKRRVRCAGRTQGNGCDEPSCFAEVIEDQIGELLRTFAVDGVERDRLVTAWRHRRGRDVAASGTRVKLDRKLARLKELYLEGDVDKADYQRQKASIAGELAALPTEGTADDAEAGDRLAAFLADVSRAWAIADATERNRIARQLFSSVVVANRTAVAVVPRPDLGPFFVSVAVNPDEKGCTGGSDGGRSSRNPISGRRRAHRLGSFTPGRRSFRPFRLPAAPTSPPQKPGSRSPRTLTGFPLASRLGHPLRRVSRDDQISHSE